MAFTLNVSGTHGLPGVAGADYSYFAALDGYHGIRGGDGLPGQPGTAAGVIKLQILTPESTARLPLNVVLEQPIDADVMIESEIITSDGETSRFNTIVKVDSDQVIQLLARGGDGGYGGNGGHGQDGGHGIRYLVLFRSFTFSF
jgi:hypothetical protein